MDDLNNRIQSETDLKFHREEDPIQEEEDLLDTEVEEFPGEETDELRLLWEQLNEVRRQLEEKEKELRTVQAEYEEALEQCRMEAEKTHFEDRLELELWKSGARNPKSVRALLQIDKLSLSENGQIEGLSEQLNALRHSDGYLFRTPATVGSKGNFVRARETTQNQSLKDAIASYYFG